MSKKICKSCKKVSFNPYICEECKMPLNYEEESNWKGNVLIEEKYNNNLIIKKDTLLYLFIGIIAFSLIYLAYTKYEERRQIEEATKQMNILLGSTVKMATEAQKNIEKSFSNMHQNLQVNNQNFKQNNENRMLKMKLYNQKNQQNNENRILKQKVNNLETKIEKYKINKYYEQKNELKKRNEAISKMREDITVPKSINR